ncbi:MAG: TIGR03936 family radical SAM-associated protein [Actinomycetota bacterium]|nr:TIGR03936 family radical SAM-associated protein [Actinomycetota bacterium]
MKLRLKFAEAGDMRWLSHLEITRAWRRIVSRAGLPVAYSEGFSPHPKIALSPALAVGVGSEAEYADIVLSDHVPAGEALDRVNFCAPMGLRAVAARAMDLRAPTLGSSIKIVDYRLVVARELPEADIATALNSISASLLRVEHGGKRTAVIFRLPVEAKLNTLILSIEESLELQSTLRTIDRVAQWVLVDDSLVDPIDLDRPGMDENGKAQRDINFDGRI